MHKLLMNPELPSGHDQGREKRQHRFALQTVGKLWPAGGKGFREGRAAREGAELFQHHDSSHAPSLKLAGFGDRSDPQYSTRVCAAHCFPTNW